MLFKMYCFLNGSFIQKVFKMPPVVGHLLGGLVVDDVPVGLFVDDLYPRALLAAESGRLAGRGHVLPGGSGVDLRPLHGHRYRSLLHANVPPEKIKYKENQSEV